MSSAAGDVFVLPGILLEFVHLKNWQFVVHKSLTVHNEWQVAELTTGFAVLGIEMGETIDDAIELAALKLEKITPEKMEEAVAKARQKLSGLLS